MYIAFLLLGGRLGNLGQRCLAPGRDMAGIGRIRAVA